MTVAKFSLQLCCFREPRLAMLPLDLVHLRVDHIAIPQGPLSMLPPFHQRLEGEGGIVEYH